MLALTAMMDLHSSLARTIPGGNLFRKLSDSRHGKEGGQTACPDLGEEKRALALFRLPGGTRPSVSSLPALSCGILPRTVMRGPPLKTPGKARGENSHGWNHPVGTKRPTAEAAILWFALRTQLMSTTRDEKEKEVA